MTPEQQSAIKKSRNKGSDVTAKWADVYRVLFPDSSPPPSPCKSKKWALS